MSESPARVLIVDDSVDIHQDYRKILTAKAASAKLGDLEAVLFGDATAGAAERYHVDSAFQGAEALSMVTAASASGEPYSLAFVDMRMPPGWDGLETIERLWEADPKLEVVLCTAYSDHSRDEIVRRIGSGHQLVILKKPFDTAEVAQLASAMTAKWTASRRAELKLAELEALVAARTGELTATNTALKQRLEELEKVRAALEISEQRYALAAEGASDGLWDWDLTSDLVYYSARWSRILNLGDQASVGPPDAWLSRVHPNDVGDVRQAIDDYIADRTERLESEHRLRLPDGSYLWVHCRGVAVRDADGRPLRMAGSVSDISRRKQTEDELRRGAYFDKLTGLPNRDLFRECLERAVKSGVAGCGGGFAVLFLDLDNFKVVNDSLGHLAGDELLVGMATRLSALLKKLPQGKEHTLARLGGDEFVVLLQGRATPGDARQVAEMVLTALERPFQVHGADIHSTASIGIAVDEGGYESPDEVLRDADTAMYHAKAAGPGRYCVCDEQMRQQAIARLKLENELRWAIQRGSVRVEYQPIMDLASNDVVSIEALARWASAAGPVSPARFIPLAEETGLIIPLGEHVLRSALRDLAQLRKSSRCSRLRVNVNLSSRQFSQTSLADVVVEALREHGLPPEALALEVTETVIMDDFDAAAATIRRLRDLGIEVYMDDFGTGYSSLSCLKLLPLTGLKLDRTFLSQFDGSRANPAIIHAIVTLARHLRLQVVAEGVETPDHLASVLALDCGLAQGFLFGRPMPLEDLRRWLHSGANTRSEAA